MVGSLSIIYELIGRQFQKTNCPRCGASNENSTHLFRECEKAKAIWALMPNCHEKMDIDLNALSMIEFLPILKEKAK